MIKVDPSFQAGRKKARARRNKRLAARAVLFIGLPLGLIAILTDAPTRIMGLFGNSDDALELVQVETEFTVAPAVQVNAFIDIAGDPTILRFPKVDEDAQERQRLLEGPGILDVSRFGLPQRDRLTVIRDSLVVRETRLITTLPSSREEFALFQTQRNEALIDPLGKLEDAAVEQLKQLDLSVELGDLTDSYGSSLETGANAAVDVVQKTTVENTTSISYVRPETARTALFEDIIVQVELDRALTGLITENGLSEADANGILALFPQAENLKRGAIVALRVKPGAVPRLLHASYYAPDGYVGTVARLGNGDYVQASDPWLNDGLMTLGRNGANETSDGKFRLLDALYSAAIRNGVPTPVTAELVAMMSKTHNLDKLAVEGDAVTIAFARQHGPNGQLAGQVMFAGRSRRRPAPALRHRCRAS